MLGRALEHRMAPSIFLHLRSRSSPFLEAATGARSLPSG